MNKHASPRFRSTEAALRFYFRAREIIAGTAEESVAVPATIPAWLPSAEGVFADYFAVSACMRQLSEFEEWLMRKLNGPSGFVARQCPLEFVLAAARTRFPERHLTVREIARVRRRTVEELRSRLAVQGLVPRYGRRERSSGAVAARRSRPRGRHIAL